MIFGGGWTSIFSELRNFLPWFQKNVLLNFSSFLIASNKRVFSPLDIHSVFRWTQFYQANAFLRRFVFLWIFFVNFQFQSKIDRMPETSSSFFPLWFASNGIAQNFATGLNPPKSRVTAENERSWSWGQAVRCVMYICDAPFGAVFFEMLLYVVFTQKF